MRGEREEPLLSVTDLHDSNHSRWVQAACVLMAQRIKSLLFKEYTFTIGMLAENQLQIVNMLYTVIMRDVL